MNIKSGHVVDSRMINCLTEQMKNCEVLSGYFLSNKSIEIARNPAKYGLHTVYHLFTIFSLIEKSTIKWNTIMKDYDRI